MNRIQKSAAPERSARVARMTADEIFACKVKLAGLMLLCVIDLIVIAWKGLPP